jgi:hypothetical protein
LRPYITDIKFEFDNYKEEIDSKIISCSPTNNFTYQNEVMNYSFILPEKKELTDLKIKITGKDPINLIEVNVNFDNILKLEDGEEMSKMIVGKALKNNEELTKDEEKEIKFAKKYQILSKNTSLFAEVINDDNQQSKLVKVELNKAKEKKDDYYDSLLIKNISSMVGAANPILPAKDVVISLPDSSICYCAAAPMEAKKSSIGFFGFKKSKKKSSDSDFFGGLKNKFKGLFSSKDTTSRTAIDNDYSSSNKKSEDLDVCYAMPDNLEKDISPDKKYSDDEDEKEPPKINLIFHKNNNNKNDYDTNLIISQDIIEGSWDENNETIKLIDIISSDTFNKIKNKITALNKGTNENKIIYTILVIYYLKTKLTSKLSEYRLVINKAEKFLSKNGINYDDIVSGV